MIEVIRAGVSCTVQDEGRSGYRHLGISTAGALDVGSMRIANWLVGNQGDRAVVELLHSGLTLRFHHPHRIAVYGAKGQVWSQHRILVDGRPTWVECGETVEIAPSCGGGLRYLAVLGGIDVPFVLGSRSTDASAAFGGLNGRPLRQGDFLAIGAQMASCVGDAQWRGRSLAPAMPSDSSVIPIRVIEGRDVERLHGVFLQLTTGLFVKSPASSRVAVRFREQLAAGDGRSRQLSEGTAVGTVQLLPSGDIIVLMADGPTTGGYPVVGEVISADIGRLAQVPPMHTVRFTPVTVSHALRERRLQQTLLQRIHQAISWVEEGAYGHD